MNKIMRYFLISDVHGQYGKMIKALDNAGFDPQKDTLVSLGDLFDRGAENLKVLEYVMKLPKKILILGNHDARLEALFNGAEVRSADSYNGTVRTIYELTGGRYSFSLSDKKTKNGKLLSKYFQTLVGAVEFSHYIAAHAWVFGDYQDFLGNREYWIDTSWINTYGAWQSKMWPHNGKKIVVGHRHACKWREKNEPNYDPYEYPENHKIYEDEHIVAIDGCSNYPIGRVNVFIIEDDPKNLIFY